MKNYKLANVHVQQTCSCKLEQTMESTNAVSTFTNKHGRKDKHISYSILQKDKLGETNKGKKHGNFQSHISYFTKQKNDNYQPSPT